MILQFYIEILSKHNATWENREYQHSMMRKKCKKFVKALLADVQAMEYMLEHKWFESGTIRIGAEQEMVMVNKQSQKPACVAMEALEKMKDYDWVETELAKFNLETNLTPRKFIGSCFSDLEKRKFRETR